jgi:excisionase family DNA binding protein
MKSRPTQFGVRENTASSRQHASRLVVSSLHLKSAKPSDISQEEARPIPASFAQTSSLSSPNNAAPIAATEGEESHGKHLLTVHEVADLLQVPVSWVYGRTRKRSLERIPSYRLGKYWRFRQEEVLAWVESQRRGSHAA